MKMRYTTLKRERISAWRIHFYFTVLAVLFGSTATSGVYRIYDLKDKLDTFSQNTYHSSQKITGHRGNIYGIDRNTPLAMNANSYHVIINPHLLSNQLSDISKVNLIKNLSSLLDISETTIENKMADTERQFSYLKKNVAPRIAEKINKIPYNGVRTQYISRRFYPNGESIAHIIGFTNHKGIGQDGIELTHHSDLTSQPGSSKFVRTANGDRIKELSLTPETYGNDLYLTVDSRLQHVAFETLKETVQKTNAKAAAAVVMDVKTGGLLAIVNYPSYNPNKIAKMDERMQNVALSHQVEPGSTVKPFVVAMALEENQVDPNEVLPTAKPLKVAKKIIHEDRIKEDLTPRGIIRRSSNKGVILLAKRLGAKKIWESYNKFGFAGKPVLQLPSEESGVLHHYKKWRERDFANHSFGYGFSTTLLKLARAYSVFATDGYLLEPTIENNAATTAKRVLSAKTAKQVRYMMESTTHSNGTGSRAAIAGYRIAGKTGTVNKVINGKYSEDKVRAFFVGIAPLTHPRYIVVVMVDEPSSKVRYGGVVAAPAFKSIMRRALLFGGIQPDDPNLTFINSDTSISGDDV